jgi:predicted nucleotidyltransferase
MKKDLIKLIEEKSPGSIPLLLVIRGSHAHGTNIETSDIDYSGVFVQPIEDILGFNYTEQINDDKNDIVLYEIKRFLELLSSNNPNILELLNTPEDCIIYKDPFFDEILNNKDKFITKLCAKSFGGYAVSQIKKATSQNKKQNWEKDKVTRKDVLDFVYVIEGSKSIPWKKWNSDKDFEEKFCGVVNVPNTKDVYAVYFDNVAYNCFGDSVSSEVRERYKEQRLKSNLPLGFGYKGLVKTDEGDNVTESNALRLSSIPKGETPICNIVYNKDGYSEHCKDFKSYEDWLANKNDTRWVDVKSHGQKIDGKKMMHCKRLIQMAREIGEGKAINVKRNNAEYLISIRRGEIDLQTLIDEVEKEIIEIDEIFTNSNLPNDINPKFINDLLIKVRKKIYNS